MTSIVQHAPRLSERDAVSIARDLFGFDACAGQLPSERDQNFHLTRHTGEQYVLKVANATESIEVLEFQNQVMMHIAHHKNRLERGIAVAPEICENINGEQIMSVDGFEGATHFVRLLSYLPGKPFARVRPHDADLLTGLGRFFGSLDHILENFDHPAAHRDFHWDLKNAGRIVNRSIDLIDDPVKSDLIQRFLERFQTQIEPQLHRLPTSVIHNDANDYNVLVEPYGKWQNRVSGVIDFGDMVFTHTVGEAAITCAYAMLNKADPLAAAAHIVAGYHQNRPLSEQELAVLFDLICMRLCMSVCHAADQTRFEPDNEYLRISEKPVWALLEKLQHTHPHLARYALRQLCGMPAVPQSGKVIDWLKDHRDGFAAIVDEDLRHENQLVFDLSVASALPHNEGDGTDPTALSEHLLRQMQQARVKVGIGRYHEARLLYTAGQLAKFRPMKCPKPGPFIWAKGLMENYPLIGDVRGLGLYVGVELVTDRRTLEPAPEHADYIINRMKDHGILISTDGPLYNVLKMKPPIVFTEQNADEVVQALGKVLSEDCLQV